jgi:hypothetical protein
LEIRLKNAKKFSRGSRPGVEPERQCWVERTSKGIACSPGHSDEQCHCVREVSDISSLDRNGVCVQRSNQGPRQTAVRGDLKSDLGLDAHGSSVLWASGHLLCSRLPQM